MNHRGIELQGSRKLSLPVSGVMWLATKN